MLGLALINLYLIISCFGEHFRFCCTPLGGKRQVGWLPSPTIMACRTQPLLIVPFEPRGLMDHTWPPHEYILYSNSSVPNHLSRLNFDDFRLWTPQVLSGSLARASR